MGEEGEAAEPKPAEEEPRELNVAEQAAEEARRESWASCIPTVFSLAPEEVTTLQPPPRYHMNLPRQSFLPLVTAPVVEHFLPFAPPTAHASSMWIQYDGEALRWQVPIGVLYDVLMEVNDDTAPTDSLPWQLVVRFQGGPVGQQQPYGLLRATVDDAKALVRCALKESTHLRCGTARPVMDLSPAEDSRIFQALSAPFPPHAFDGSRRKFQSALAGSVTSPTAQSRQPSTSSSPYDLFSHTRATLEKAISDVLGGEPERAIPIRVFVTQREWRQLPVSPTLPSGDWTTLADALELLLPQAIGAARDGDALILVQGVVMALNMPLPWLYSACAHPDGFLYVSCHMPKGL
mmetsp:Transcript_23/g.80  ORF Transcript_23/g.80 Transcript_23/m.80 type:complete len:349 (-) Transcript_23:35-1081(-)